jgi:protease-4
MKKLGSLFYTPRKRDAEISEKRWNFGSIIWKAIVKTCTVIGAVILISAIVSTILVTSAGQGAKPLPKDMVLVFKIEEGVTEIQTKPTLLEPFPFVRPTLRNVIDTIDKARDDDRVRGIIFSLKGGGMSIAHIQELRTAIQRFRESEKFTKIYAPSYVDGGGTGFGRYYLASAFEEVWMQPVGMVSVSGINMKMPFGREALEKIGVRPQFFKREKFKTAMENFTNEDISEPNKAMLESITNSLATQMVTEIAIDRDLGTFTVNQLVDKGLLTGQEALNAKLIDRLDYADVMVSEIKEEATGNPEDESIALVSLAHYSQEKLKPKQQVANARKNVALIYIVGTIVDVTGKTHGNAGADEISAAIMEARDDEDIDAIVLRVDSPGGSPTASETIRRAVVKAKEKGKKVIVSMGPVAASGGYWVSTDADEIFASSGTLTGSIGVVMGKFEASKLWEKLGINWNGAQYGESADIWSLNEPFDEKGKERMNVLIDDVYDAFLTRVAEGRGLRMDQVRQIAQGRAWTGEQARNIGLVDDLGGLDSALDRAAQLVGADTRHDINVVRMPKELSNIERLLQMLGQEVSLGFFGFENSALAKSVKPWITQYDLLHEGPRYTVYDPELEMVR